VEGGETIPHETLTNIVAEKLTGAYLKLIPYRFTLLYPHDTIVEALAAYPRVKEVTLTREHTVLTVNFTEYTPYALWCLPDTVSCYFLDETGYAFGESPSLAGGALIRHVLYGEETLSRKQLMPRDDFTKLHHFLDRLATEMGIRVTEVRGTHTVDLTLSVNGGGALLIENNADYDRVFENLRTLLASKEFAHIAPGNFQYIDLRFGNKVFVNEELASESGTSSPQSTTTQPGE